MKITLNKNQWELIGKKTGWFRKAQVHTEGIADTAKEVICDSGKRGWQDKLQNIYSSLEELISYNNIYGICKRLGYEDPAKCWEDNPTIQGSIIPSDLKRVANKNGKKQVVSQNLETVKTLPKLNDRELTRALRDALIAEEGAIKQYEVVVDSTDNKRIADTLQEIADEEKVHVFELQELLNILLPDEKKFQQDGKKEIEDIKSKK